MQTPRAKPAPGRNEPFPTPFTALQVSQPSCDRVLNQIRRRYGETGERLIPVCWLEKALEGLDQSLSGHDPVITGVADNHDGLQILMIGFMSPAGQLSRQTRHDGVPFHAIWSAKGLNDSPLTRDENYTWQSRRVEVFDTGNAYAFNVSSETVPGQRVLRRIELEAENLARAAAMLDDPDIRHDGDDFDHYPLRVMFGDAQAGLAALHGYEDDAPQTLPESDVRLVCMAPDSGGTMRPQTPVYL